MSSFYTFSFGCRVNQAEIETINKKLIAEGLLFDPDNPDIFIINSCSVTQKAEREVRNLIYRVKKNNVSTKIVLTGCAATYWNKNKLYNKLPVYLWVNNNKKRDLHKLILEKLSVSSNFIFVSKKKSVNLNQKKLSFDKYLNSGRHLIKIQDGCHRFCSYCIVPYLRGQPKSVSSKIIIEFINKLPPETKEVILTAINTEAYGKDIKESFTLLIDNILVKTQIARLSFGSINPWSVNSDFFNLYNKHKNSQRLIHFFHIPLQSGSDKILKLMKRGYSAKEFIEKLNYLNKLNPFAFLATDIIAGFLNETEKDFEESYNFLEKTPLNKFHVFRFSIRKNTAAFYMSKKIRELDEKTKNVRVNELIKLSKKKYLNFLAKHLDKNFQVLFLNKKIGDYQQALLNNQILALIRTNNNLSGEIKDVKIKELKNGYLMGKLV